MSKRVSMFDQDFEPQRKETFRTTVRLSRAAYERLLALEAKLVLEAGVRPSQATRARIISLALERMDEEGLLESFKGA